jgi:hypothetical protein
MIGTESVVTKKSPLENYFCSGHKRICFKMILVFAQLSTSTASRPSISGLSTKTLTSTLNAIIYYIFCTSTTTSNAKKILI